MNAPPLNTQIPTKARTSGICPLCSRYITKNRSWILPLPEAISPRGDGRQSSDDGRYYNADGRPISMHPRKWAHQACWPRYFNPPKKAGSLHSQQSYGYDPDEDTYAGAPRNIRMVYSVRELLDADLGGSR